jgi:TP901 family phage tail tape measure protein
MADNPLKYSQFIEPDDSIKRLIKELEQVLSNYDKLTRNIIGNAAEVEATLKKLDSATEANRKATAKAVTDVEKLVLEQKKLNKSREKAAQDLAKLKVQQLEQNQINKLTAKLNAAQEGSYNKLSAQYSLNKIKLNALGKEQRSNTASGKALEKQTRDIYEEMNRLQKATGKHTLQVGNYGIATENLHPILGRVNMGLRAMGTSLDDLKGSDKPLKALKTAVVNFGKATVSFLLSPLGMALTLLGGLFLLIRANKGTVIEFNRDLIKVGKTADLSGDALASLGVGMINLSRSLKVIKVGALLKIGEVAGQLGIKGSKDILNFTEALAKLETATNVEGQIGATQIARFLTITEGGVQNVEAFADELTNLGNEFAAFENEILSNSVAIAQNTAQFNVSRRTVLAYGTATKAVGLEAEVTGSTIGRTLALLEKSIRTGKNINAVVEVTKTNIEDLKKQFRESPETVFNNFVAGLNEVSESGGSVNQELANIGVTAIRDRRVLGSLATKGFGTLKRAIEEVKDSSGALNKEFTAASKSLENQLKRTGIAWDNFMLQLEDGEGVIARVATFFTAGLANSLDAFSALLIQAEANWAAFKAGFTGDDGDKAYWAVLTRNFGLAEKAAAEAAAAAEKRTQAAAAEADFLTKNFESQGASLNDLDEQLKRLRKTLQESTSGSMSAPIQKEIADLEKKRDAILNIVEASKEQKKEDDDSMLRASLMREGKAQDLVMLTLELEKYKEQGANLTAVEKYRLIKVDEINKKYSDKKKERNRQELQDQISLNAKIESLEREKYEGKIQRLDDEYTLELSRIDLLKLNEAEKTRLILEAELKRFEAILLINEMKGSELTEIQLQTLRNTIAKVNQELASAEENKQHDIYSIVGLSLKADQKQAISEAVSFTLANLRQVFDAKIQMANQAIAKAREEVSEAKQKVATEKELLETGQLNDLVNAQEQLKISEAREAAFLKQRQKAQRDQQRIDTAMQLSSLVTAASKIWASLAAVPPLAVAAISLMFGSFAAAKISAAQVTQKQEYGEGGFEFMNYGGSHASGNDIGIGMTKDGKQRTMERGETLGIVNKSSTAKYRDIIPSLFNSLNGGTFEQTFGKSYIQDQGLTSFIVNNNSNYDSKEIKSMNSHLGAIRRRGENEKTRYVDGQGRFVEVNGNVKTTYV